MVLVNTLLTSPHVEEFNIMIGCPLAFDILKNPAQWPLPRLSEVFYRHSASQKILSKLDYSFQRPDFFLMSMVHSSFSHELMAYPLPHNERLEFLGDAILQSIVSIELCQRFPTWEEGTLSRFRSRLVNKDSFAEWGEYLELSSCLLLGRGELKSAAAGKKSLPSLLADSFEALFGALFWDGGFSAAQKSFLTLVDGFEKEKGEAVWDLGQMEEFDPKTRLQELTMALYKELPRYEVEEREPGHPVPYLVHLVIQGTKVASEEGVSKKKAERALALKALRLSLYKNKEIP